MNIFKPFLAALCYVCPIGCARMWGAVALSPGSPLTHAHMTFASEHKLRRGRAWYAKSRDPKITQFPYIATWLPELPCTVTCTCIADLPSYWDVYRLLYALARL